jgi:hypothetical protein
MITNVFIDVVIKAWFWHNGKEERGSVLHQEVHDELQHLNHIPTIKSTI